MKNQALFSSKDKSKKLKCRLLQFLFGALRVNGGSILMKKILSFNSIHILEVLCWPGEQLESHTNNFPFAK